MQDVFLTGFVQAIIYELMQIYAPNEVRFLVYDSKDIEYQYLNRLPHMLLPVITDNKRAEGAVGWLLVELQRRRTLGDQLEKAPHIFFILDDCISVLCSQEAENGLYHLLRVCRGAKIHCILVTSLPTKSALPDGVKVNLPLRISFRTATKALSRTVIDIPGAETLNMPGEMMVVDGYKVIRCKSVYYEQDVLNEFSEKLYEQYKDRERELIDIELYMPLISSEFRVYETDEDTLDDYLDEAAMLIIEKEKASIGMLQRRFKIGFNRAARLMDQLCEAGVIGEEVGTKPREVLMTSVEEWKKVMRERETER